LTRALLAMVVVGLVALLSMLMARAWEWMAPDATHFQRAAVSCPLSEDVAALRLAVAETDKRASRATEGLEEMADDNRQLRADVGRGLVDIACLYRWSLATSRESYGLDSPVATQWHPRSPLLDGGGTDELQAEWRERCKARMQ
jgi:hypothetical protein